MTNPDEPPDALLLTQINGLRHRLRKHLQNMIGLMSLQIRRARSAETIQALVDLRARFATLTSIFIDLDEAPARPIALDPFVPDLVRCIGELYDPGGAHEARFNIAPLALPGSRAALLGQIVVELAMNVYRHAFAGRTAGTIAVDLTTAGEDEAVLVVADDGPGLPEDVLRRKHFGLTSVEGLAEELGGRFNCANHDGLVARVRFPLDYS